MNRREKPPSSLDVFLLALIDSGVATSYAMREQAGISVGASRPALQRLKQLGLVVEGKTGVRGKVTFKLAGRGRRAKETGLNLLLDEYRLKPPSDLESILRVAAMSISEAKSFEARELFRAAAEAFGRRNKEYGRAIEKPTSSVAGTYLLFMAMFSDAQQQTISSLFANFRLPARRSVSQGSKPSSRPRKGR